MAPVRAHAAEGRAQAGGAAAHARVDDAALGLAADGEGDQSGSRGRGRTGTGAARAFLGNPGILGLSAEPHVVERQRAEAELGDHHRAGLVQAMDHGGILVGHAVAERLGAPGGAHAGGVQQVLAAPGHAVQRSAVLAGGNLAVGLPCLFQCLFLHQRDHAQQLGVMALDAVDVDLRQALGTELARADPVRQVRDRRERDRLVAGRQRPDPGTAGDEAVTRGSGMVALEHRVPDGGRGRAAAIGECDLARPGAALELARHRGAPVAHHHQPLGRRVGHLHQLFGFGEGYGRHVRAGRRRGVEGGRRARRGLSRIGRLRAHARGGGQAEQAERGLGEEVSACLHGDSGSGDVQSDFPLHARRVCGGPHPPWAVSHAPAAIPCRAYPTRRRCQAGRSTRGSAQQLAHLVDGLDEAVDFLARVVERQRGARRGRHAVEVHQRVRAVVA